MSTLTDIDKRYLERLFEMQSGYVLDYSDVTFQTLFNRHNIDIHGPKYSLYGTSKAKKLRCFWEREPNEIVEPVLSEMIESYEVDGELNGREIETVILEKSKAIIDKLAGRAPNADEGDGIDGFLNSEFIIPNIHKLPVEQQVAVIIEARLSEARIALKSKAFLSVIFLCGSVLEAVLLGAAQKEPKKFNQSNVSPKNGGGKVKPFHEWSLSQLIDTACDVRLLKPDVKKFSHGLRDFRNYIHPYEQMLSGFSPDEHTAKVCFQVLKAALASVAGERK